MRILKNQVSLIFLKIWGPKNEKNNSNNRFYQYFHVNSMFRQTRQPTTRSNNIPYEFWIRGILCDRGSQSITRTGGMIDFLLFLLIYFIISSYLIYLNNQQIEKYIKIIRDNENGEILFTTFAISNISKDTPWTDLILDSFTWINQRRLIGRLEMYIKLKNY